MSVSPCPEPQRLTAFRRGELADDLKEQVAVHVSSCSTCQARLGQPETVTTTGESPPVPPGYKLLDEVGRGGMGVVYRACDTGLNREVAVKLLSNKYAAHSAAATRFKAEAQITGQLQHPGIPAVHELGELPDGRPFLAMKLVKGRTLHELLKERSMLPSPSGRGARGEGVGRFIAIFEQVCPAVGYAHTHHVIHRDLKPSNVMVGSHGEVQVMDWGLAKLLDPSRERERPEDGDDPLATVAQVTAIETPERGDSATRTGSVLGTPSYMPPEQAAGEIRRLDPRSDVFGLGAILCQILTGRPPYEGKDDQERRVKAVRGELHEAFARLDACGAEPELIALCKRCLAFRQEERPEDGNAVAREVGQIRLAAEERARQAEVARARAEVAAAEQRKRRRVWVGLAASLLVGFVASLALAAWAVRAERIALAERDAKDAALQAEQRALAAKTAALEAERAAKELAEERRQQAERNLAYAKKGNELVGSVLAGLDPKAQYATLAEFRNVLRANLGKVIQELEGEAVGDALTVAELQDTLGRSLVGLGDYEQAIIVFEKSRQTRTAKLGPDHPDTLTSMNNLALGYRAAGNLDLALPLYEETLKLRKAKLGPDHPDTLTSMNNLALGYHAAGKLDRALPLQEETLKLQKAKLGPDHPDTLTSMNNLASGYQNAGKLDKALPLLEETLKLFKAKLGPDHPNTLTSMANLGKAYCDAKQGAKAAPLLTEFVAGQRKRFPKGDPRFAGLLAQVALALLECEQFTVAEEMLRECLAIREKAEPDAWTTFNTMAMLGGALLGQKKYAQAEPLLVKGYHGMKAREQTIPPQGKDRLPEALDRLIELSTALEKPDEVKKYQELRAQYPPAKEQEAAK